MCDTFVAMADATANGSVILAKNSDREPNEAHEIVYVPAGEHAPGSVATCTYLVIPQARRTNAVLLGKPYWIWGAEMGANYHGVVIGNEAVFTKAPHERDPGLIGNAILVGRRNWIGIWQAGVRPTPELGSAPGVLEIGDQGAIQHYPSTTLVLPTNPSTTAGAQDRGPRCDPDLGGALRARGPGHPLAPAERDLRAGR